MKEHNELKAFANNFAKQLVDSAFPEKAGLLASFEAYLELSQAHSPSDTSSQGEAAKSPGEDVGIWRCEHGSKSFVRRLELVTEWNFWANLGKIEKRKTKRHRIVLIGESVARGYLYDPQFTPAAALENTLQRFVGADSFEVIDLARTDLGFDILDLTKSTAALNPDVVAIVAGNNWSWSGTMTKLEAISAATELRNKHVVGLKEFSERRLEERVRRLVTSLGDWSAEKKIPIIWIVPEFNLGDWKDSVASAPYLARGDYQLWEKYRCLALSECGEKHWSAAAEAAMKMIELDGGTNPTGPQILATCSRESGNMSSARHYLELARDSRIWDEGPGYNSPRIYSISQKILRERLPIGFSVIDLPLVFERHLDNPVPGRRLFLDYCHLTAFGIQLAVSSTAAKIIEVLGIGHVTYMDLLPHCTLPSDKIMAEAAFLAAVHNAHWDQPLELVEYYCGEALRLAPEIIEVLEDFINLQVRETPILMSKVSERIVQSNWPSISAYLLRYNRQQLDPILMEAIERSLNNIGVTGKCNIKELWQEHRGPSEASKDLLDYYFCSANVALNERRWVVARSDGEASFFKSHNKSSKFSFVASEGRAIVLELTCRLPTTSQRTGAVLVEVNDGYQLELLGEPFWQSWAIKVPEKHVKAGINELKISWPEPEFVIKEMLDAAADDLSRQKCPQLYPVFGEVHALFVRLACSRDN